MHKQSIQTYRSVMRRYYFSVSFLSLPRILIIKKTYFFYRFACMSSILFTTEKKSNKINPLVLMAILYNDTTSLLIYLSKHNSTYVTILCQTSRYLMSRLSLQVIYLWRHVLSSAPVGKFRNTICPPPSELSLHRRAALSSNSNGTRYV
jgi:hypothetical protein